MFADCCEAQTASANNYRGSLENQNESKQRQNYNSHKGNVPNPQQEEKHIRQRQYVQTPLKIKLLNAMGLSEFLIDKFIFVRPPLSYKYQPLESPPKFEFNSTTFEFLPGYQTTCSVIDLEDSLIPVIHFIKLPQPKQDNQERTQLVNSGLTIVYSHGNSSNLEMSFQIIGMMARKYPINYIVYDYTGYGNGCVKAERFIQSRHKLSDKSICSDLLQVIKWSQVPVEKLILWGYSLGCHPSLYAATQLKVNSLIIQSPFASIYSMANGLPEDKPYKNDIFNNIQLVQKIQSDCLLIHSQDDGLIPVQHSKMLMRKFNQAHRLTEMRLIEIGNIKHNEMPLLFCVKTDNPLQQQLNGYLQIRANSLISLNPKQVSKIKKKPIQLNGSLQPSKQLFRIIIDQEQVSQINQSLQLSAKNIELQMRLQQKRYFPASSKRPLNLTNIKSKGYSGANLSNLDTEVSDEILLSEREKHDKKLNFGEEDELQKNSLKLKKMHYFSIS